MDVQVESFDPAFSRVVDEALPSAHVAGPTSGPRVTRAIRFRPGVGVGAVSGGELVLASSAALESMGWPNPVLGQLGRFGFSGLVITSDAAVNIPANPPLPIGFSVLPSYEVRHVEERLAAAIAKSRQELYAFVQLMQRQVVDLAISGRGLEDVIRATAQAARCHVLVRVGKRTWHRSADRWLTPEDHPEIQDGVEAVIGRRDHSEGTCVIYGGSGYRDEAELAASRCALACTIVLARETPLSPISALLDGQYDPSRLASDIRSLHYDLDADQHAIALSTSDGRMLSESRRRWPRHIWAIHEESLFGLLSADDGADLARFVETLFPGVRVATAAGGPGLAGAERSLSRARRTLEMTVTFGVPRLSYEDVSAELTLRHIHRDRALDFAEEVLRSLTQEDRRLERETLLAYLDANRNAAAAASKLNVHRNTVLYRLRAIEPLLGRSLENEGSTFDVYLALRLHRLFGAPDSKSRADP